MLHPKYIKPLGKTSLFTGEKVNDTASLCVQPKSGEKKLVSSDEFQGLSSKLCGVGS